VIQRHSMENRRWRATTSRWGERLSCASRQREEFIHALTETRPGFLVLDHLRELPNDGDKVVHDMNEDAEPEVETFQLRPLPHRSILSRLFRWSKQSEG
jgi:hypothetical protein